VGDAGHHTRFPASAQPNRFKTAVSPILKTTWHAFSGVAAAPHPPAFLWHGRASAVGKAANMARAECKSRRGNAAKAGKSPHNIEWPSLVCGLPLLRPLSCASRRHQIGVIPATNAKRINAVRNKSEEIAE
jgi:hypothetical protein